jgi:hypothetical protein
LNYATHRRITFLNITFIGKITKGQEK